MADSDTQDVEMVDVLRGLHNSVEEARSEMSSYFAKSTEAATSAANAAKILKTMLGTLDNLLEASGTEGPGQDEAGKQGEATNIDALSSPPADEEEATMTRTQSLVSTERKKKGKAPAQETARSPARKREESKSSPATTGRVTRKVQKPKIPEGSSVKTSPKIHALGQYQGTSGPSNKKPLGDAEGTRTALRAVAAREAEKAQGAGQRKAKAGKDSGSGTKWGLTEFIRKSRAGRSEMAEGTEKRKAEALDGPESGDGEVGEAGEEEEEEELLEEEKEEEEEDSSSAAPPSKRCKTSTFTTVN